MRYIASNPNVTGTGRNIRNHAYRSQARSDSEERYTMAKKAIVMAGGHGTRLGLLTKHGITKIMLPVYDRPMIVYPIETLVRGGITDIRVALNGRNPQLVMDFLQDGAHLGCRISYTYHAEVFAGPVRHFMSSEDWVGNDDVVVMLGDSYFRFLLDFAKVKAPHIWTMPLENMDDPRKYGQVKVSGDRVSKLVEKPKKVFSGIVATGCWVFPSDVFARARKLLGKEGELQFADLSMEYVRAGAMTHTPMPAGSYLDLGTPTALFTASQVVAHERQLEMLVKR